MRFVYDDKICGEHPPSAGRLQGRFAVHVKAVHAILATPRYYHGSPINNPRTLERFEAWQTDGGITSENHGFWPWNMGVFGESSLSPLVDQTWLDNSPFIDDFPSGPSLHLLVSHSVMIRNNIPTRSISQKSHVNHHRNTSLLIFPDICWL